MKILIIKTGLCETFAEIDNKSQKCSLGDVFRTTFILNFYQNHEIHWLTDPAAKKLLDIENIDTLYTDVSLINEEYELVINLEKDFTLFEKIRFDSFLGFYCNERKEILVKTSNEYYPFKIGIDNSFQKEITNILGFSWNNEQYLINRTSTQVKNDIGLNWKAGTKWPEKLLPEKFWKDLEENLSEKYSLSWQKGFDDLEEYISWIDSCKRIITLDSLGFHLALAMKKDTIGLFGPTTSHEMECYGLAKCISYDYKQVHNREYLNKLCDTTSKLIK